MIEFTRRRFALTSLGALGVSFAGCLSTSPDPEEDASFTGATVHLSPNCECCEIHSEYLAGTDADVEVVEHSAKELSSIKSDHGIPQEYRSCHTTELDSGHVAEGHVPVDVINSVVEESPSGIVVALPGMPSGSPGMPGSKDGEWVFYAIDEEGETEVFTRK